MSKHAPKLDPELSLGYQVRRCHRRFDRLLSAYLAKHELKTGFWYYLRVLWLRDGVTQKYLSDMTNVTENTTVAMINAMLRRKLRITLTDHGRALEKELMQYAIDINKVAVAGIEPREVEICRSVLERISANLAAEFDRLPAKPADEG